MSTISLEMAPRSSVSPAAERVPCMTAVVSASREGENARAKAAEDDDIVLEGCRLLIGVRGGGRARTKTVDSWTLRAKVLGNKPSGHFRLYRLFSGCK